MKIQCCDCKIDMGEKPGGNPGDISHSYCEKCLAKVKMDIWVLRKNHESNGKRYHPWITEAGKFIIFESEMYKGGLLFSRYCEFDDPLEMDRACRELNE